MAGIARAVPWEVGANIIRWIMRGHLNGTNLIQQIKRGIICEFLTGIIEN